MAVGEEIELEFAGSEERRPLALQTFTELAARTDSQYSYLNSLVAVDDDGSLAVFPQHRGRGLAVRLIDAARERHAASGKPIGLLVDTDNPKAYALYRSLGFVKVGARPFAGTMMDHLQLKND